MASAIDTTQPPAGAATTAAVRGNFLAAKNEIEALQALAGSAMQPQGHYADDTGVVNAYVVNTPQPVSFTDGAEVSFSTTNANTGACTINVSGTGAISIRKSYPSFKDQQLAAGDIRANEIITLRCDGTYWMLQSMFEHAMSHGEGRQDAISITEAQVINLPTDLAAINAAIAALQAVKPSFSAYQSASQTINNETWTKLSFQTKEWDTTNNFDATTNYQYKPNKAGKYLVTGGYVLWPPSQGRCVLALYKNGIIKNFMADGVGIGNYGSTTIDMNGSTDYIELFAYQSSGVSIPSLALQGVTYFQANLLP